MRIIQNPQRKDDKFEDYHYPPTPPYTGGEMNARRHFYQASRHSLTPCKGKPGGADGKLKAQLPFAGDYRFAFRMAAASCAFFF